MVIVMTVVVCIACMSLTLLILAGRVGLLAAAERSVAVDMRRHSTRHACPHNVWGVDEDDKVVCLDCGERVKW